MSGPAGTPQPAATAPGTPERWWQRNAVMVAEMRRLAIVRNGEVRAYPAACALVAIAWTALCLVAAHHSGFDRVKIDFQGLSPGSYRGLSVGYPLLFSGIGAYLVGLLAGWMRLRRALTGFELSQMYFSRLTPREILTGLMWPAMVPYVLALGVMALGLCYCAAWHAALSGNWWDRRPESMAGALTGLPAGFFVTGGATPAGITALLSIAMQFLTGTAAHAVGTLGGSILAIRGHTRTLAAAVGFQVLCVFLLLCCSGSFIGVGIVALLQLSGYRAVVGEFWWHTVFIPEDPDYYHVTRATRRVAPRTQWHPPAGGGPGGFRPGG